MKALSETSCGTRLQRPLPFFFGLWVRLRRLFTSKAKRDQLRTFTAYVLCEPD